MRILRFSVGLTRLDEFRNEHIILIREKLQVGRFGEKKWSVEIEMVWACSEERERDEKFIGKEMREMALAPRNRKEEDLGGIRMEQSKMIVAGKKDKLTRKLEKEDPLWRPLIRKSQKKKIHLPISVLRCICLILMSWYSYCCNRPALVGPCYYLYILLKARR